MSPELAAILQPIIIALIAGAVPGVIAWLANRRKDTAASSQILVGTATDAAKALIDPLTKRVIDLENERAAWEKEKAELLQRIEALEHDYAELSNAHADIQAKNSRIERANAELRAAIEQLKHIHADLQQKYLLLEAENVALRNENVTLQAQNQELTARLDLLADKMDIRQALFKRLEDSS
jgi:chromosome segregation ATPase